MDKQQQASSNRIGTASWTRSYEPSGVHAHNFFSACISNANNWPQLALHMAPYAKDSKHQGVISNVAPIKFMDTSLWPAPSMVLELGETSGFKHKQAVASPPYPTTAFGAHADLGVGVRTGGPVMVVGVGAHLHLPSRQQAHGLDRAWHLPWLGARALAAAQHTVPGDAAQKQDRNSSAHNQAPCCAAAQSCLPDASCHG